MRVSEAIGLRIQDIDFGQNEIIIKRGKGDKDRCTMFPGALKAEIKDQMEKVKKIHEQDLKGSIILMKVSCSVHDICLVL